MRVVATAVAVSAGVLAVSGCGGSHAKPAISIRVGAGAGRIARREEVRIARSSNVLFSIFPSMPGKRKCVIPHGGLPRLGSLRGTCQTSLRPDLHTHEPAWIVSFTERWRRPACAPDLAVACSRPMTSHTWRLIEGMPVIAQGVKPRVVATRSSGAAPPQEWK
jgi:hypothetical protein